MIPLKENAFLPQADFFFSSSQSADPARCENANELFGVLSFELAKTPVVGRKQAVVC